MSYLDIYKGENMRKKISEIGYILKERTTSVPSHGLDT
jgi:hypothetical protein